MQALARVRGPGASEGDDGPWRRGEGVERGSLRQEQVPDRGARTRGGGESRALARVLGSPRRMKGPEVKEGFRHRGEKDTEGARVPEEDAGPDRGARTQRIGVVPRGRRVPYTGGRALNGGQLQVPDTSSRTQRVGRVPRRMEVPDADVRALNGGPVRQVQVSATGARRLRGMEGLRSRKSFEKNGGGEKGWRSLKRTGMSREG